MTVPLNKSEQFTHNLCTKSFLSLWCYNNPIGKKNKELCDVLSFVTRVIVFSVKEITLEDPDTRTKLRDGDGKQLMTHGSKSMVQTTWLETATHVIHSDGSTGIPLPPIESRRVHGWL